MVHSIPPNCPANVGPGNHNVHTTILVVGMVHNLPPNCPANVGPGNYNVHTTILVVGMVHNIPPNCPANVGPGNHNVQPTTYFNLTLQIHSFNIVLADNMLNQGHR